MNDIYIDVTIGLLLAFATGILCSFFFFIKKVIYYAIKVNYASFPESVTFVKMRLLLVDLLCLLMSLNLNNVLVHHPFLYSLAAMHE